MSVELAMPFCGSRDIATFSTSTPDMLARRRRLIIGVPASDPACCGLGVAAVVYAGVAQWLA